MSDNLSERHQKRMKRQKAVVDEQVQKPIKTKVYYSLLPAMVKVKAHLALVWWLVP